MIIINDNCNNINDNIIINDNCKKQPCVWDGQMLLLHSIFQQLWPSTHEPFYAPMVQPISKTA